MSGLVSGFITQNVFFILIDLSTPFIIFWLCQAQMQTNTISQAAQMEAHGIPNDMLPNLNSITVLIFLPLMTRLLYPYLRRHSINTPPLRRIALGFLLEAAGMAYAAGTQSMIYSAPPCFSRPRACLASPNGSIPNAVHIAVQTPIYFLEGLAEIFASPAGYEYAFTKAPMSMKSVVQAVYGLTAAGGSIIALALTPTNKDPLLLGMYSGVAGAMFVACLTVAVVSWRSEQTATKNVNEGRGGSPENEKS
jgi:POT family proton-dependent oligopeptide transporter